MQPLLGIDQSFEWKYIEIGRHYDYIVNDSRVASFGDHMYDDNVSITLSSLVTNHANHIVWGIDQADLVRGWGIIY